MMTSFVYFGGVEGESYALRFTRGQVPSCTPPKHEGNPFPQTPIGSASRTNDPKTASRVGQKT